MNQIRTSIHDGRIDVAAPDYLPDGSEVIVVVLSVPGLSVENWELPD